MQQPTTWRRRLRLVWQTVSETLRLFSEQQALRWAAAISYYTAFALAPLLVVLVAVAGLVLEPQELRQEILVEAKEQVGAQAATLLERLMQQTVSTRASLLGLILGFALALLGASSAVLTLKDALNAIFAVRTKPGRLVLGTLFQRGVAVASVLSLGVVMVLALLVGAAALALAEQIGAQLGITATLVRLTNALLTFALLVLLVAAVYKVLADVRLTWRQTLLAAIPTSLLLLLAQSLIGAYLLGHRDIPATYGAAASLAVILIWIYLNAGIILFGAAFLHAYRSVCRGGLVPTKRATQLRNVEPDSQPPSQPPT